MKDLKIKASTSEGWAVHVYDGDRCLRCTLEPIRCYHNPFYREQFTPFA